MSTKLGHFSITIMTLASIGIITSVILEAYAYEPIYVLVMKVCAGLFGIGGPLLGWAIVRRRNGR